MQPLQSKNLFHPSHHLKQSLRDWQIAVDYDRTNNILPPEITATNDRPDIVIWSMSLKTVLVLEQTCPAEEGIEEAAITSNEDTKVRWWTVRH